MTLQQRASKSWAKTSRTAALPTWTNLVGGILLVFLVLGLVSRSTSHHTTLATIPVAPPLATTIPATQTTTPPAATTSLLTTSGVSVRVPLSALRVGEAAAKAVYTGNLNRVALTPSAIYTAPSTYYPSPKVTRPRLQGSSASTYTFSFSVTPEAGLSTMEQVVTITNVNGPWQWTGEAG